MGVNAIMLESAFSWYGSATPKLIQNLGRILLVGTLLLATTTTVAIAQISGGLQGTVRDAATGQPLRGARVSIFGSNVETRTDPLGRYTLLDIIAEEIQLRIECSGYTTMVEQVTVLPGSVTSMDFQLASLAVMLKNLVVRGSEGRATTGRGTRTSALDSQGLPVPSLRTVFERFPELQIMQASGQAGSGLRVRLRGEKGLVSGSAPLVYVDGIRVQYPTGGVHSSGVAGSSVFDMIDASEVERVEILRGPSATAMYGTGALNGVILITTKGSVRGAAPR